MSSPETSINNPISSIDEHPQDHPQDTVAYVEVATPSIAGGRWVVHPGDVVEFERPDGTRKPSLIAADTLRSRRSTWRQETADEPQPPPAT